MKNHLTGEKNGKKTGNKLNIAVKDAGETNKKKLKLIDKTEIKNTTGLVWFGNDLRIHDNDVLSLAVKNHSKVIGVYIIDPCLFEENEFGFKKMDVFRTQFLLESLQDLKHQLLTKNISLLVFLDQPEIKIKAICDSYQD